MAGTQATSGKARQTWQLGWGQGHKQQVCVGGILSQSPQGPCGTASAPAQLAWRSCSVGFGPASWGPAAPPELHPTDHCAPYRGLPSQAFEYIHYNKGIMGEDAYPYRGQVTSSR